MNGVYHGKRQNKDGYIRGEMQGPGRDPEMELDRDSTKGKVRSAYIRLLVKNGVIGRVSEDLYLPLCSIRETNEGDY